MVITDPWFVSAADRDGFLRLLTAFGIKAKVEWIMFENNPEKALRNLHRRKVLEHDPRVINTLTAFQRVYNCPDGIVPRVIWQAQE